jgi:hypothetical protein
VIIFSLPAVPGFSWNDVNYSPLVNIGVFLAVAIWWFTSAKNTFKGPVRTLEGPADGSASAPAVA